MRADELLSGAVAGVRIGAAMRGGWRFWRWVVMAALATPALLLFILPVIPGRTRAPVAADKANLQHLYLWLTIQKMRQGMPTEGGHRLLTNLWTRGLIDTSPENLRVFFNPGRRGRDPHYRELRARLLRGERIWTDSAATTSRDTHYAALATPFLAHLFDEDQVIAADDCEDGWPFKDNASHMIHLLYGDGRVREMQLSELPVFGPSSPIPELQRLER